MTQAALTIIEMVAIILAAETTTSLALGQTTKSGYGMQWERPDSDPWEYIVGVKNCGFP